MRGVTCYWCPRRVTVRRRKGHPPMTLDPDGQAHAATCPERVRVADLGVRKYRADDRSTWANLYDETNPVQKLIPAAAKMREPITVRAKR